MSFDGFYAAYFTGVAGNSLAMFTFKDGRVAGADLGHGRYDGTYQVDHPNQTVNLTVGFILPPGFSSITGASASDEAIKVEVPLTLPVEVKPEAVHSIQTPLGPINARFEKINSFD